MRCATSVVGSLKKVPGVESAEVDFDKSIATVVVKGPVTDEMLLKAASVKGEFQTEIQQ